MERFKLLGEAVSFYNGFISMLAAMGVKIDGVSAGPFAKSIAIKMAGETRDTNSGLTKQGSQVVARCTEKSKGRLKDAVLLDSLLIDTPEFKRLIVVLLLSSGAIDAIYTIRKRELVRLLDGRQSITLKQFLDADPTRSW